MDKVTKNPVSRVLAGIWCVRSDTYWSRNQFQRAWECLERARRLLGIDWETGLVHPEFKLRAATIAMATMRYGLAYRCAIEAEKMLSLGSAKLRRTDATYLKYYAVMVSRNAATALGRPLVHHTKAYPSMSEADVAIVSPNIRWRYPLARSGEAH